MKVGKEDESGGVSHYTLVPTGSDLTEPSDRFRSFVGRLNSSTVSTAVTLGQFQHQLQRSLTEAGSLTEAASRTSQFGTATSANAGD